VQLSLPTMTRILITTHNLRGEAHFHHTLSTMFQVSVHHIWKQMIKHILFANFIQLQYVLPLSSTSKSLPAYCNPTPKIQCTARNAQSLKLFTVYTVGHNILASCW
jgi:hypothetical protein